MKHTFIFLSLTFGLLLTSFTIIDDTTVYIRANKNSTAYHLNRDCFALKNCKADKLEMKRLGQSEALLVYAYGGTLLDLPIADRLENYSTPHWVPTIIKRK